MDTTAFAKSQLDKLGDATPVYAALGAGDLAVEKFREARVSFDADSWRDQAQARLAAGLESVQAELRATPDQLTDLPVRLQVAMADALSATVLAYGALATRGREVLDRLGKQQPAAEVEPHVEVTVFDDETATTGDEDSDGTTEPTPPPVV